MASTPSADVFARFVSGSVVILVVVARLASRSRVQTRISKIQRHLSS
jgi:hypothetical protein